MQRLARVICSLVLVYRSGAESSARVCRHALPPSRLIRCTLREGGELQQSRPWQLLRLAHALGLKPSPRHRVRFSHTTLHDLIFRLGLGRSLPHRPIWPMPKALTVTLRTDASMTAGYIVRLFTDNMVVMQTVTAMVSRSPQLMAELRRLHAFRRRKGIVLQRHHLPLAMNLYADGLSRGRHLHDYLPRLPTAPGHCRVVDSEHDMSASWRLVQYLRPPLELLPLVPRQVVAEKILRPFPDPPVAAPELAPGAGSPQRPKLGVAAGRLQPPPSLGRHAPRDGADRR